MVKRITYEQYRRARYPQRSAPHMDSDTRQLVDKARSVRAKIGRREAMATQLANEIRALRAELETLERTITERRAILYGRVRP